MKAIGLFTLTLILSGCQPAGPLIARGDISTRAITPEQQLACPLAFPKTGLCGSIEWTDSPVGDRQGALLLRFWEAGKGDAVDGPFVAPTLRPFIKLWMPTHGHGARAVVLEPTEDGVTFKASDVRFSMPGPWDVRVQLKDGSTVVEEVTSEIEI